MAKVQVIDAGGTERWVEPVDAKEIIAGGGKPGTAAAVANEVEMVDMALPVDGSPGGTAVVKVPAKVTKKADK